MALIADLHAHYPMHVVSDVRHATLREMHRIRPRHRRRWVGRVPTMGGLERSDDLAKLAPAFRARYGTEVTEQILSGNARRVVRTILERREAA